MSLLENSQLTEDDLATRLKMDAEDDSDGLKLALAAACSDIEPHVAVFAEGAVPAGLKLAILDIASTYYDRATLAVAERIGTIAHDHTDQYNQMMQRIAPYRVWVGL